MKSGGRRMARRTMARAMKWTIPKIHGVRIALFFPASAGTLQRLGQLQFG